jgi:uncharacterized protein with GYD domain
MGMPAYMFMITLKDEGLKVVHEDPKKVEAGLQAWQAAGGILTRFILSNDEYDIVVLGEAPDNQTALVFMRELNFLGDIRMVTVQATADSPAEKAPE